MNSGIADAHAAAAAIHAARGGAGQDARAAIENFAKDRHEAAVGNRQAAGQALTAIQGRGVVPRAKRRIAVTLAPRVERAAAWLDSAPYGPRLRESRRLGRFRY
jgi:3-(3-hydroxy-phenyl)propionate hydroxylase